ncbi:uncharacterized protein LOC128869705 [Anastrepha ludens]|uniref:uncharacterized protein LOC128869705 n=1 Tax=Anastrepha ludens TaxID=28586 RepID=UPI0023AF5843|nr:uncharacterized protein LOC128869705 [Anastrepha ludens]
MVPEKKSEAIFRQMESIHRLATTEALRSLDQVDLTLKLELVDNIRSNFELTQNRLEEEDPDELDTDARQQFLNIFISVKGAITRELQSNRLDSHLHSTTRNFSPQDSQSVVALKQPKSCLPELKLPTFRGNYSDWPQFFSMFRSIIDREAELTKVEKLQHPRSCLADAALDTIKSLEIREYNYDKALELLNNRFDNKRLIFQSHIRELLGLESVEGKVATNFRRLTDTFLSHIRALHTLGSIKQLADSLLIHIVMQKFDSATQNMWEEKVSSNELSTWEGMAWFLEKRCQTLENVAFATLGKTPTKQVSKYVYRNKSFVVSKPAQRSCVFCKHLDHLIYTCPYFAKLSRSERWKEAKNAELCRNCLKLGHRLQQCKFTHCFRCKGDHHTLLHKDIPEQPIQNASSAEKFPQPESAASLVSMAPPYISNEHSSIKLNESVLLATATVFVKNSVRCFIACRAILDSASQLNFATSRLSNQLLLKKSKLPVAISGIGDSGTTVEYTINIIFKSIHSDYTNTITASIIPTITEQQPTTAFSISHWVIPENIKLADPSINTSRMIDLLIGAGIFFDLLCVGQIRLKEPTPIFQKTRLGWIVFGGKQRSNISSSCAVSSKLVESKESNGSLDQMVRSFWETENGLEGTTKVTKEELDCEIHFQTNHCRLGTGEYSVRLPVKLSPNMLGD